jgi:hypothetical protein
MPPMSRPNGRITIMTTVLIKLELARDLLSHARGHVYSVTCIVLPVDAVIIKWRVCVRPCFS